jgi:hypothetical protein
MEIENKDKSAFSMCMFDSTSGATLIEYGLTKREYIATQVLSGLCANYLRENVHGWDVKTYVVEAIELTDNLLKELDKPNNQQ